MKIVVASDSFKGSLSSSEIAELAEIAALKHFSNVDIIKVPIADGGEGTVEALFKSLNAHKVKLEVHAPAHNIIQAEYGIFNEHSAFMEMACASGISLVAEDKRFIRSLNTYGTGELILDALNHGCKNIYMGIGGSATNDGGLGMLSALGIRFLDKDKNILSPLPENFLKIAEIDDTLLDERIHSTNITIMCDVVNPLLGENGATRVFAKQKGAKADDLTFLEDGMKHLYTLVEKKYGKKVSDIQGAGAAGGLGAAFLAFTNAKLQSGITTILEIIDFENIIQNADFVVTGEGQLDTQSMSGKVVYGVSIACKKHNIPCFAIVGGIQDKYESIYDAGLTSVISCIRSIDTIENVMQNSKAMYQDAIERLFRVLKLYYKQTN